MIFQAWRGIAQQRPRLVVRNWPDPEVHRFITNDCNRGKHEVYDCLFTSTPMDLPQPDIREGQVALQDGYKFLYKSGIHLTWRGKLLLCCKSLLKPPTT